jgi:hypothetical protein
MAEAPLQSTQVSLSSCAQPLVHTEHRGPACPALQRPSPKEETAPIVVLSPPPAAPIHAPSMVHKCMVTEVEAGRQNPFLTGRARSVPPGKEHSTPVEGQMTHSRLSTLSTMNQPMVHTHSSTAVHPSCRVTEWGIDLLPCLLLLQSVHSSADVEPLVHMMEVHKVSTASQSKSLHGSRTLCTLTALGTHSPCVAVSSYAALLARDPTRLVSVLPDATRSAARVPSASIEHSTLAGVAYKIARSLLVPVVSTIDSVVSTIDRVQVQKVTGTSQPSYGFRSSLLYPLGACLEPTHLPQYYLYIKSFHSPARYAIHACHFMAPMEEPQVFVKASPRRTARFLDAASAARRPSSRAGRNEEWGPSKCTKWRHEVTQRTTRGRI